MSLLSLYRSAYLGLSRETWFLALVVLINRSGTMVIPFMTMYATQKLGYSVTNAGFLMALFGVGSIIGAFFGGRVTDKFGFYNVQLFALFGGGIMFIIVGYLTSYPALCIGVLLLSTINESFRPAHSTAIAHYSKTENRTRSYSLNRLSINLGWAFGGALGGFLASKNYHYLFWVDGITNISAAVLLLFVLAKPTVIKHEKARLKEISLKELSPYKDKQYLIFLCMTVLFAFCFFQMFTILPVFLKQKLFLSESSIGLLMAINGLLIASIEMVLVFTLEKKGRLLRYITWGVWMVGIAFVIYNIFNSRFLLALVSIVIITVGEMFCMPFMNTYWINRSSQHNRGQYAAMYTMGWGLAQIAAPSIGGWVADTYSYNMLWWIVFGITMISGLGFSQLQPIKSATIE